MKQKKYLLLGIIFFSFLSCIQKEKENNHNKNFLGSWRGVNLNDAGFKVTDSTVIFIHPAMKDFIGLEFKYTIKGDTIFYEDGELIYILRLTNDTLITKNITQNVGPEIFTKVKE